MKTFSIIVTGMAEGPRSDFISALSEHIFAAPEKLVTSKSGQEAEVVFGRIAIGQDMYLYLANIPGDEGFEFLWERLADGLLGFVVVCDAGLRAETAERSKALVLQLKQLTDLPFVVFLHGLKDKAASSYADLKKELGSPREDQTVCGSVKEKADCGAALTTLLNMGVKQLKKVGA